MEYLRHTFRGFALGLLMAVCIVGVLQAGGCDSIEPTTASPLSGRPVTAAQLAAEIAKAERDAREKAIAEDNADKIAARAAQATATKLAIETAAKMDITAAEVKRDLASAQADASIALAAISARSEERAALLKQTLAGIQSQADSAFADIEGKQAQRNALAKLVLDNPIVKGFAGTAGVDTSAIVAALGVGSTGLVLARRKAVADKTWEEAAAAAHRERDARDAAYEEGRAHAMMMLADPTKLIAALSPKPQG